MIFTALIQTFNKWPSILHLFCVCLLVIASQLMGIIASFLFIFCYILRAIIIPDHIIYILVCIIPIIMKLLSIFKYIITRMGKIKWRFHKMCKKICKDRCLKIKNCYFKSQFFPQFWSVRNSVLLLLNTYGSDSWFRHFRIVLLIWIYETILLNIIFWKK